MNLALSLAHQLKGCRSRKSGSSALDLRSCLSWCNAAIRLKATQSGLYRIDDAVRGGMNRLPTLPARGAAAFEQAFARRMLRLRKTGELNATSCSNAPAGPTTGSDPTLEPGSKASSDNVICLTSLGTKSRPGHPESLASSIPNAGVSNLLTRSGVLYLVRSGI